MPPVLHVALDELAAGSAEDVRARDVRLGVDERHRHPGADRGSRRRRCSGTAPSGPTSGRRAPGRAPAVEHGVEGGLRRAHADDREPLAPSRRPCGRSPRWRAPDRRSPSTPRAPVSAVGAAPEENHDLARLAGRRARARTGARRTDRAPRRCGRSSVARCRARSARRVPFRPRNSRRSAGVACTGSLSAQNATQPANCGSKCSGRGWSRRAASNSVLHLVLGVLALDAERPLDVGGHREAARPGAAVGQAQQRDPTGRVRRRARASGASRCRRAGARRWTHRRRGGR